MQEFPVARQVVQSVAALPEVLEMVVVGTTGAVTVPSVPVPLVAAVLGRRMWRTEPPLILSTKASFWPSIERTGDVVIGPPVAPVLMT
jgi:hypothetical protein